MAVKNKHNYGTIVPKLSFIYSEKMSSSDSDSDPLIEELKNIQMGKRIFVFFSFIEIMFCVYLVIHVTRENIDALNAKFANLQNPPSMYIIGKCHSIFRSISIFFFLHVFL